MAFSSLRLRRTLTLSSSLIRNLHPFSTLPSSHHLQQSHLSPSSIVSLNPRNVIGIPSHCFQSTSLGSYSTRSFRNDDEKFSEDTILFEGCDYKHWLITIDFPKGTELTAEEMVETYVQTAAKVVGSVEEAKKLIYACSTTTYHGFQIEVTEEVSEKFKGLPGVVFILPDSYIDPVNKEYGGDKYINGQIIPRPPPVQHGRSRFNDRNRNNYDRPRYDRQRDPPQGDGRTYGGQQGYTPQQSYSQQQYSTPQQNYPPQQNYSPQGAPQNYPAQDAPQSYPPQGPQQSYPPQGPQQNYPPQGPQQNYPPQGPQQNYSPQGPQQNYSPHGPQQNNAPSRQGGNFPVGNRDYASGGRDQRYQAPPENRGDIRPFPGDYRQGAGSSYGQNYPVEQRDGMQGEQRNYTPIGQAGNDQAQS